jgi:cytochrome P450/NADPH-cytochrome P450 reductase
LPSEPETTPMICIAAGSGIAPFRAFLQERAVMMEQDKDRKLAPALLFFGCRAPGIDDLYREQLEEWQARGVVDARWAFSRQSDDTKGCRHVDDRILADREDVVKLWRDGARVYVCGSGALAQSVRSAMVTVLRDEMETTGDGSDNGKAEKWFDEQRNVRYVMDVFD